MRNRFDMAKFGMLNTWLIQRLEPAPKHNGEKMASLMSFGGGGSGLTREAHEMLHRLWSFEYMGAAEFEFGTPARVLSGIFERRNDFVADTLTLRREEMKKPWRYEGEIPEFATVYVLADKKHMEGAKAVIREVALDRLDLKEHANLDCALMPSPAYSYHRTVGWIEYDNGFFFFTDREMWERVAAAFGVAIPGSGDSAEGEG